MLSLALPEFAAAAPEVVHGDPASCVIRWVHSSEVYEMGSLLQGGELLLTTGLGLHGHSRRAQAGSIAKAAAASATHAGRAGVPSPTSEGIGGHSTKRAASRAPAVTRSCGRTSRKYAFIWPTDAGTVAGSSPTSSALVSCSV